MRSSPGATVGGLVATNAAVRPDDVAIVTDLETISFGQLAERGRSIASRLLALGLQRQDRVAILAQNCAGFCELYAACELGALIAVTINYRNTVHEMAHVIRDSGAAALFFAPEFAGMAAVLQAELTAPAVCIEIDADNPDWAVAVATLDELDDNAPTGDDVAYLIYTSGTTGKPKGCMIGQHAEAAKAQITAGDTRMSAADRILLSMPLFHIGAKAMLNAIHWVGGAAYIHAQFRPENVLAAIERDRITMLHLAPTMVATLLEHPGISDYNLSSLRAIVYSASAMPLAILRRGIALFGPIFYQIYGLTEGIGTFLAPEHHVVQGSEAQLKRLRSIGLPSPGVELRIGDHRGDAVPDGEAGEILLLTPTATLGYWNNSGATVATLRNGWLRTGDIGYRDRDGFIYLIDRAKDMIVSGGENIYSREVEDALYQHPAVLEAAVIGVPDLKWGEAVRAVIVPRPDKARPSSEELTAHVRALIASYKKPRDFVFIDALPKTANGKIDKQAIRVAFGTEAEGIPA